MIGYLKGKITHVFANSCFIEVGGVGYRTIVSGTTLGELSVGKETMLYTYMSVTENDITLYGFLTQDEYELFLLLITVNGIGPKLAVNALGAVTPDTLRLAIRPRLYFVGISFRFTDVLLLVLTRGNGIGWYSN